MRSPALAAMRHYVKIVRLRDDQTCSCRHHESGVVLGMTSSSGTATQAGRAFAFISSWSRPDEFSTFGASRSTRDEEATRAERIEREWQRWKGTLSDVFAVAQQAEKLGDAAARDYAKTAEEPSQFGPGSRNGLHTVSTGEKTFEGEDLSTIIRTASTEALRGHA